VTLAIRDGSSELVNCELPDDTLEKVVFSKTTYRPIMYEMFGGWLTTRKPSLLT
jgi:hypothetical protein